MNGHVKESRIFSFRRSQKYYEGSVALYISCLSHL